MRQARTRHARPGASMTAGPVPRIRQENSVDNRKSARARQRILAIFLPVTAVLYISAEALSPKGTDQVISTTATALKVLPTAARHPAQLYVAGSLALLGLGCLAVSYAAIAALARNRGSAAATVAALIGGLGAFCGAIVNVLVYPNLAAAATAHLTPAAAARFLVTTFNSGFGHVFLYAYLVGEFVAPVLMGYALWRSRSVPRGLAALFVIGLYAAEYQSSGGPIVVLYMLPFAAAMVLLAARLWQAAALPASRTWSRPVDPCSSTLRRPGQSQKGRSKPRGSLWPGFLFRPGSRPVRFALLPVGPAAWYRSPSRYRRR
jgi:hypothetical protein